MLDELLELETRGWKSLSSSEEGEAARFYAELLDDDAMMLFPGGLVLDGRSRILDSLAAQPWKHFQIDQPAVVPLGNAAGVLTYRVTARREGAESYIALISSTYVRVGGRWKLKVHQHTPT